jgi:NADH-quinone oxidoreductase subunit L
MAAPTPVRALVHSSTLVTAGIYLVIRGIFYGSNMPSGLITLGAITALLGAYCSVMEYDLKKAIAYSTLSHCGLIIYGLGINC